MNLYANIFRELNKHRIQYLVIGGVAVNVYGYQRFTGDIDILLALDPKNLVKMEKLMYRLGYLPRLPVELHDLGDRKKVKDWMKTKNLKAYTFLADKNMRLDIDIVVRESLRFEKMYKKRTIIEIWGARVPVISLRELIAMKKRAGRDKDLLDLKELFILKGGEEKA